MTDDPNRRIIDLIAKGLREGFVHPGDPERDVPPTPVVLPFKAAPGQPKEMTDLLDGTVKLLSECIVSTIVNEGQTDLVPRAEAAAMRRAVGDGPDGPELVPVHCRCDTKRQNPLMILTVTDPERIVVDGGSLLRGLAKRSPRCPHDVAPAEPEADQLRTAINGAMDDLVAARTLTKKARALLGKVVES